MSTTTADNAATLRSVLLEPLPTSGGVQTTGELGSGAGDLRIFLV